MPIAWQPEIEINCLRDCEFNGCNFFGLCVQLAYLANEPVMIIFRSCSEFSINRYGVVASPTAKLLQFLQVGLNLLVKSDLESPTAIGLRPVI